MADKIVYLMRGLPSTGKSYTAKKLAGEQGCVCETDDYFYTQLGDDPEKYSYDVEMLKKARDWSYNRFQQAVDAGVTPIVVDRGNSLSEESQRYVRYCMEQHYLVELKEPDSPWWGEIHVLLKYKQYTWPVLTIWSERLAQLSLSTHRVSASVIQQRMERWQWDLSIEDILEYNPGQNKQAAAETTTEISDQSNFADTNNDDEYFACTMLNVAKSNDISDCLILNTEKEKEGKISETLSQLQLNIMFDATKTTWQKYELIDQTALAMLTPFLNADKLDGVKLGYAFGQINTLGNNTEGNSWLVDATPEYNEEFHKYSKSNVSGLAYIKNEVSDPINLLTVESHETGHIIGFKHGELDLMDDTLEEGVQVTSVAHTDEQLSSDHAINNGMTNKPPVSDNNSFSYKLKEKLNDFGNFKLFDDYKGGFSSHTEQTDDKGEKDFLMFSNTEYDKEKQADGSCYEITEHDRDEKFESFGLTEEDKTEEGAEATRTSALIDWSTSEEE